MKRTISIAALILVTTMAFAETSQQAKPPQGGGPGLVSGGGELLSPGQLAKFLNLSEAQKTSLQQIHETLQTTVKPLANQIRGNQEAIEAAAKSGDAAKAGQLIVANYGLSQQIKNANDAARTASDALLTAAQKAKLAIYLEIVELRRHPDSRPKV